MRYIALFLIYLFPLFAIADDIDERTRMILLQREVEFDLTNDEEEVQVPAAEATTGPAVKAKPLEEQANSEKNVDDENFTDYVLLLGMNKITAKTSKIKMKMGSVTHFGNLEIYAKLCSLDDSEEVPVSKAQILVYDHKPGELKQKIFNGWMISKSPAISALEHPVYDITVISCLKK